MCRKNSVPCANDETPSGSPPRVREKPFSCCSVIPALGITPACAGKTRRNLSASGEMGDHPRVCGKNFGILQPLAAIRGSPPRVREKLLEVFLLDKRSRITPACAGKTNRYSVSRWGSGDHPRVCGKNLHSSTVGMLSAGSPPRVREKHTRSLGVSSTQRITPACAGKTLKGPNEIKTFLSF